MTTRSPAIRTLLGLRLAIGTLCTVLAIGCRAGPPARAAQAEISGQVTERADGYSERPQWADANRPWTRQGDTIRVVGYVAIRADQRKEAGYRAADSYARAELVRFLSLRVASVLEDQLAADGASNLRERIEVTARSWIDDLAIAQRYYERRKTGETERLHIWSRVDIDPVVVAELLQRATKDATDLRIPTAALVQTLKNRWDRVADVGSLNEGEPMLPPDVTQPSWAKGGDQADDSGFSWVCYGLAKDEKTARALARARCNEKLCRQFGVQITAKSKVLENLDGITAENEVSEECATVRVAGRATRYQSSECGPHGCIHWLMQHYPRSAFDEEKKRLDQPTVIRQEVVIQEGGKVYRDPKACEASLRAYSTIATKDASGLLKRQQHLRQAMKVCQGIDGRDSGLFSSLNHLLTSPLRTFTIPDSGRQSNSWRDPHDAWVVATSDWQSNIDSQRFLTDRITTVLALVNDAILPLKFLDIQKRGGTDAEVDAVIREVIKFPFATKPASPYHVFPLHALALALPRYNKVAYSNRYRTYLLGRAEATKLPCSDRSDVSGGALLAYLAADGDIDDREWQLGLRMLRDSAPDASRFCLNALWDKQKHPGKREKRIEQIASMIASGEIRSKDATDVFHFFLQNLQPEERRPLFVRYRTKLTGSSSSREEIAKLIVSSSYGWEDWDWQDKQMEVAYRQCEAMPNRIGNLFVEIPEAKTEDSALCFCLRLEHLRSTTRKTIANLLRRHAKEECDFIRAEDLTGR